MGQAFRVLVFSKTAGFRHDSIPAGIATLRALGDTHDFAVDATEDAGAFTGENLAQYAAVVFLNTTGDVLNAVQQTAFEGYIQAGGGYVGVHSAADTEYSWPFYGELVGAYFESHPNNPNVRAGTIKVADQVHPSSAHLPKRWDRTDEWYSFRTNPRGNVHVLATLDERTYQGGTMGHDHPIAWCLPYQGGRAWYTALGHTIATYDEPLFREHLLEGVRWSAGAVAGDCSTTLGDNFEKVLLDGNVENPIDLDVAGDGRVFFIELGGKVKVYEPAMDQTRTLATLPVYVGNELGLIGIALDPGFAANGWLYLYYAPAGTASIARLSRFTTTSDALDRASEQILFEIPVNREQCCHAGGSMAWGADGNLFLATGDDANPFASDGYAPIDERPGRAPWDAQRSAANTKDLRGKILRITPQPDGTYALPPGNLFEDAAQGRPEIYVMGVRNPYRIAVDAATGWLYWGDVGPDASAASATRGPEGLDEWNQAREAGNYGWPYCIGPNRAYRDYDFATNTAGALFDCAAPVNDSPNNTGIEALPPAQPAWIWYPYGPATDWPAITNGGGRTAMAGPIYHFDPDLDSPRKLPAYYDETFFIYEWSRNWIHEVKLDDNGGVLEINPFAPEIELHRPIAMELGPDGALYVIEWGAGFGGDNPDAGLVRIDFRGGTRSPVAMIDADPTSGPLPLTVQFSAARSFDPDPGDVLAYAWDFDGDGTTDATGETASHTYTDAGGFTARLFVTDGEGHTASASVRITAGNTRPTLTLTEPPDGGFFDWGDVIPFAVSVTDAEDGSTAAGTIACEAVNVQPLIGHDDHGHPLTPLTGCADTFTASEGHGGEADNVFHVLEASYTDAGPDPLTARAQHILRPKRLQAEHFTTNGGTQVETSGDTAGGGENIGFIDHGDFISFTPVNLTNIGFVTYRVASAGVGGRIEVRVDAPDGPLLSTALVETTGNWQRYRDVTTPIDDPGGTHELFFVFKRNPGDGGLFNVNWIDFHGRGVAEAEGYERHGLTAAYFNDLDFTGRTATRIDPQINFNWGNAGPIFLFGGDTFSARWTGQLEAPASDTYTFSARSSDGMRVWLDGQLIIDRWVDQGVTETTSLPIRLDAGKRYDLKVEYYEQTGEAQAHLSWSSGAFPKMTVPSRYLFPDATSTGAEDETPRSLRLGLAPAFPNPFSDSTTLAFTLPHPGNVRLDVFDVLGRRVLVLADAFLPAGAHTLPLDGAALPSGSYLCRLAVEGVGAEVQRVVMVK